jgi:hypothetical protein
VTEVDHLADEAIIAIVPERGDGLAVFSYVLSRDEPAGPDVFDALAESLESPESSERTVSADSPPWSRLATQRRTS